MLLNCLAHYINRNHAHHDEKVKGTRWRWLTKYFDAKGFFEWEEERVQDIDHTIDSKIDKLTEQVVALTALVSTVPGAAGGVAAIEALGAAKPSERSDSGPAGWSQRMNWERRIFFVSQQPSRQIGTIWSLPVPVLHVRARTNNRNHKKQ